MKAERSSHFRRLSALALGLSTWGASTTRALADAVHPFAQVGVEGAFDGNITGHDNVAVAPWSLIYTKGPQDWHGGLVLAGGTNLDLTDRLSALGVLELAGQRYLDYPVLSGLSGAAYFQGKAVDLPGDLDGLVTYSYRNDFLGDQGHDVTGGVQRPLPFAVVGYADAGYDWSLTVDSSLAHQGPFADVGATRRFRSTGTTVFAGFAGLSEAYLARTDRIVSVSGGVSQNLFQNLSLFGRVSYDWVSSTEADRSLASPEVLLGTAWAYP